MQILSSQLSYQSLNGVLPSMKCSVRTLSKCKNSVYVLTEICLQSSKWVGPTYVFEFWTSPMEEYDGWISKSQTLIVVSTLPLTNLFLSKCKHLTSPECPVKVITDHLLLVLIFHTLIVLSWLPLTILAQSNWIQEIAAEIIVSNYFF